MNKYPWTYWVAAAIGLLLLVLTLVCHFEIKSAAKHTIVAAQASTMAAVDLKAAQRAEAAEVAGRVIVSYDANRVQEDEKKVAAEEFALAQRHQGPKIPSQAAPLPTLPATPPEPLPADVAPSHDDAALLAALRLEVTDLKRSVDHLNQQLALVSTSRDGYKATAEDLQKELTAQQLAYEAKLAAANTKAITVGIVSFGGGLLLGKAL
jgi:hypothetical protein